MLSNFNTIVHLVSISFIFRISKSNQRNSYDKELPSLTVPQSSSTRTAVFPPSSLSEAVPVPQLHDDHTLEEVCEEFGGELNEIQDQKEHLANNSADLALPINCFHPLPSNASPQPPPPATNCKPSSSNSTATQNLHLPFIHNDTTQLTQLDTPYCTTVPPPGANHPTHLHISSVLPGSSINPQPWTTGNTPTSSVPTTTTLTSSGIPWLPSSSSHQLYGELN